MNLLLAGTAAIVLGALLDRIIGDPRRLPHLVRGIGSLIAKLEPGFRAGQDSSALRRRGFWFVVTVVGISTGMALAVIAVAYSISIWLGIAIEAVICCQCLAAKSLRDESIRVQRALVADGLAAARSRVSMIVGRDTATLTETGVARAAVETVAENTSDGVIAPLLAMGLGGGVGAVAYKAVNTLDSMIGYRNDRYLDFGHHAARLDDVLNWIPARISALLLITAAGLHRLDPRNAHRIWRRDHAAHTSPNSAHPEAACAGALGIQLGGPASYGGISHDKPTIGDPHRPITPADITAANQLMSTAAWLCLILVVLARLTIWAVIAYG